MNGALGCLVFWAIGFGLDYWDKLKWEDFGLPSDFPQQLEVEVIADIIKVVLWFIGGILYWKLISKWEEQKEKRKNKTK